MRRIGILVALTAGLVAAPSANAAIPSALGVTCIVQGDNVRFCGTPSPAPAPTPPATEFRTTAVTWDGVTPIDVNVAFPPAPAGPATDGNFPLIMMFHGYGGSKINLAGMHRFLDQGYATMSITDRGFGQSCGRKAARSDFGAACANGYNHLQDTRYEVRDAQFFAAELAGAGLVDPTKIGAIGGSYGGGKSMAIAALNDRIMKPDGTYDAWKIVGGPNAGQTISLAAAAPEIPWTDLSYSLVPNGSTLDYVIDNAYTGRIGVQKQSYVNQLYSSGCSAFSLNDPDPTHTTFCSNTDPQANLQAYKARLDQGEPYDGDPAVQTILNEIEQHHSSYYIDHSRAPAPLFISNGWTDDLFPADEAIRFYNRTRSQFPNNPISLMFLDYGHPRGQSKAADIAKLAARENGWFAKYVKGVSGPTPFQGVETLTQTCPAAAPSGGPFFSSSWEGIHPGEVRMTSDAAQTIQPNAGDATIGSTFDPIGSIFNGGTCAKVSGANLPGAASYRMPAAQSGGYTLMGSPTVIADFTLPGPNSQVAARLVDVGPDGQENLVARGLWRPQVTTSPVTQVFQLHPNGYKFAEGHVAKLELLPNDAPYGQTSNGQQPVTVANLELRLPVLDQPGSAGGSVQTPLAHFFPGDMRPTRTTIHGHARIGKGKLLVTGKVVKLRLSCSSAVDVCSGGKVTVRGAPKKGKRGRFVVARAAFSLTGGQSKTVLLKLTKPGRSYFKRHRSQRVSVNVTNTGITGDVGYKKQIRTLRIAARKK